MVHARSLRHRLFLLDKGILFKIYRKTKRRREGALSPRYASLSITYSAGYSYFHRT